MESRLSENSFFNDFVSVTKAFIDYRKHTIPLCAAENVMSEFVKLPLSSAAQEKYVMGGLLEYIKDDNFIGGETIYPYYEIIDKQCRKLFGSAYADSRTLTGMNSVTTLLMSLTDPGDTVAISMPDCGGHASIPDICHRLGLKTIPIPYNYDKLDFDYSQINELLKARHLGVMLFCLSDIINPPDFSCIHNNKNVPIIYDATQTLGLIAGGVAANPFSVVASGEKFILMGATHKTIPGPSCSLIMTKNIQLAETIEKKINPMYLRNTQMHQKMSLIFALLEIEYFGKQYGEMILQNSKLLAKLLASNGFDVLNTANDYTSTHQIHITCSKEKMESFYDNCTYYNITVNFKTKKSFRESGIRIGTQEISRYGWGRCEIEKLSKLLTILMDIPKAYESPDIDKDIKALILSLLQQKNIHYIFSKDEYSGILNSLLMD